MPCNRYLQISKIHEPQTIVIDLNSPIISSFSHNFSQEICGTSSTVRVSCTTYDVLSNVSSVVILAGQPNGTTLNYSGTKIPGEIYYADIPLTEIGNWTFICNSTDFAGNTAINNNLSLVAHSVEADLKISSQDISINPSNPVEGQIVKINSTIYNEGCTDVDSFLTGFYDGNPHSGGLQIGNNQTASLFALSSVLVNITWIPDIGSHQLYVLADVGNIALELNESNNLANLFFSLYSWHTFYGNISIERILASSNLFNMSLWLNNSLFSGNIYVADVESEVSWASLKPFGKNISESNTTNDFVDIDTIFSMNSFNDSISNIFTLDGSIARNISQFTIQGTSVESVPIIPSTNTTSFITGILWDSSDDLLDGEFSQDDEEDIIFVSKVNHSTEGAYGVYDYEIRVPARLREYKGPNLEEVYFYFDLT